MTWLADVASGQQIISSWGNAIRNRIVQTFDSSAEANTHLADLPDGATASIPTLRQMYTKYSGAWYPMIPMPYTGGVAGGGPWSAGQGGITGSFTIPAGYRNALLNYQVLIGTSAASLLQIKCFTSNGGIQVAATNWAIGAASDTRVFVQLVAVNPNGDIITISILNTAGGPISCYSDGQNHNFAIIGFP